MKGSSEEVRKLRKEMYKMYIEINKIIEKDLLQKERNMYYSKYSKKLKELVGRKYEREDAQRVQTRIKNQKKNLLTAIKVEGVPLTNNQAERDLRPLVVMRKISGGSRSEEGAKMTAVNMSLVQTIQKRGEDLIASLGEKLLAGAGSPPEKGK